MVIAESLLKEPIQMVFALGALSQLAQTGALLGTTGHGGVLGQYELGG